MYLFSNLKKYSRVLVCIIFSVCILSNFQCFRLDVYASTLPQQVERDEPKTEVEKIYNKRSSALVSRDYFSLDALLDTSQKYGKWALEHEIKRVKYLTCWLDERNITFTNIQSTVRIKKIYPQGKDVKLALEETYNFDYVYNGDESNVVNTFGVGIRHTTSLIIKNEKWAVYNDWYTDCFEDALQNYTSEIPQLPTTNFNTTVSDSKIIEALKYKNKSYDRKKVVAYADKYCGAA